MCHGPGTVAINQTVSFLLCNANSVHCLLQAPPVNSISKRLSKLDLDPATPRQQEGADCFSSAQGKDQECPPLDLDQEEAGLKTLIGGYALIPVL